MIRGFYQHRDKYTIKPVSKDNKILSLVIKNNLTGMKVKFLDSMQIVKGSLRDILIKYECNTLKGLFPYRIMNKDNLYYVGVTPNLKYYDGISLSEYNDIACCNDWSAKDETLKYLQSDILGLLEVVTKRCQQFYDKYSLDITKYRTLPSAIFAAYTSNYYDESYNIKMTNGFIEKDIRSAYFGGNVDVFEHVVPNGAVYLDMNSQYPYAMLQDMPIGNPIITNETDITNFFGFAFGTIIPPTEDVLKNLFIQNRDKDGSDVYCPRYPFKRLIFSEEIKYAISEGYQFEMEWGYKFNRGKGVFDSFVNDLYSEKKMQLILLLEILEN